MQPLKLNVARDTVVCTVSRIVDNHRSSVWYCINFGIITTFTKCNVSIVVAVWQGMAENYYSWFGLISVHWGFVYPSAYLWICYHQWMKILCSSSSGKPCRQSAHQSALEALFTTSSTHQKHRFFVFFHLVLLCFADSLSRVRTVHRLTSLSIYSETTRFEVWWARDQPPQGAWEMAPSRAQSFGAQPLWRHVPHGSWS